MAKKSLEELLKENSTDTGSQSKEDYYRRQRAIKMVNDYQAVIRAREEMKSDGMKTTKDSIIEYLIKQWEDNKVKASEEEI